MKKLELSRESLVKCENTIMDAIVAVVENSNRSGAVVAISGGIDSALVATLASRVVDVYGLILPEPKVTGRQDVDDAKGLAESLGIDYEVIDIGPIVRAVESSRPKIGPEECMIAYANIKPRVRMIINYFAANLDGRIVLGTGNRTELLLGYFTKYGDGGVDMLPIGGLYKTQVRQMARHLKVPERIVNKAPSAGLWAGQTDEEELGATYEMMDMVLSCAIDEGMSLDRLLAETGAGEELVNKLMKRVAVSEHKRNMPPVVDLSAYVSPR